MGSKAGQQALENILAAAANNAAKIASREALKAVQQQQLAMVPQQQQVSGAEDRSGFGFQRVVSLCGKGKLQRLRIVSDEFKRWP